MGGGQDVRVEHILRHPLARAGAMPPLPHSTPPAPSACSEGVAEGDRPSLDAVTALVNEGFAIGEAGPPCTLLLLPLSMRV